MTASPAERTEQYYAAVAALPNDAFAPRRGKKAPGLRGGAVAGTPQAKRKRGNKGPLTLTLTKVRYAEDAIVSGTAVIPGDPHGAIVARLTAVADSGERVKLIATWSPLEPGAAAAVQGTAGSERRCGLRCPRHSLAGGVRTLERYAHGDRASVCIFCGIWQGPFVARSLYARAFQGIVRQALRCRIRGISQLRGCLRLVASRGSCMRQGSTPGVRQRRPHCRATF